MRAELWLSVMAGSSHPGFDSSAMVGKRSYTSAARIARFWPNIEAPTAANYVGFTPRFGHSAAQMHRHKKRRPEGADRRRLWRAIVVLIADGTLPGVGLVPHYPYFGLDRKGLGRERDGKCVQPPYVL